MLNNNICKDTIFFPYKSNYHSIFFTVSRLYVFCNIFKFRFVIFGGQILEGFFEFCKKNVHLIKIMPD